MRAQSILLCLAVVGTAPLIAALPTPNIALVPERSSVKSRLEAFVPRKRAKDVVLAHSKRGDADDYSANNGNCCYDGNGGKGGGDDDNDDHKNGKGGDDDHDHDDDHDDDDDD